MAEGEGPRAAAEGLGDPDMASVAGYSCSRASPALGCSVCRNRHFHHSSWFSAPYTPGGILTGSYHEGFWLNLEKEGFHRLFT